MCEKWIGPFQSQQSLIWAKNIKIPFSWLFFVFLFPHRLIRDLNIVKLIQIRYDNFARKTLFAKTIWSNFWIWLLILIDILWICFLSLILFLAIEIHTEQVRSLVTLCDICVFRIHAKSVINFILTLWKVNIFTRMFWCSPVFFFLKIHQQWLIFIDYCSIRVVTRFVC